MLENAYQVLRIAKKFMIDHDIIEHFTAEYMHSEKFSWKILPEESSYPMFRHTKSKIHWLRIKTEHRQIFQKFGEKLMRELASIGANVSYNSSWRWEGIVYENRKYIPVYEIFISGINKDLNMQYVFDFIKDEIVVKFPILEN